MIKKLLKPNSNGRVSGNKTGLKWFNFKHLYINQKMKKWEISCNEWDKSINTSSFSHSTLIYFSCAQYPPETIKPTATRKRSTYEFAWNPTNVDSARKFKQGFSLFVSIVIYLQSWKLKSISQYVKNQMTCSSVHIKGKSEMNKSMKKLKNLCNKKISR